MGSYITDRLSLIAIGAFLTFLLFYGACITGLVLKEPDICFLLGSGRWIVEHGHLPAVDPFSYTTHYHWAQYVIEKWLTEVIFYVIQSNFTTVGLLVFDAIMLSLAFVVMPYRIAYLCGWRGFSAMGLVFIVALTSLNHPAVRPEIFSFLLTGILLEVLLRVNQSTKDNTQIQWRAIALLAVLMCLWSNLHTLFMVGNLLTFLYSGCLVAERVLSAELRKKPLNWTVPIAAVVCLAATLVNPYGFGLWGYMPNVFGPFNDTNNEMQPIKLSTARLPQFWPFFVFVFAGAKTLIKKLRQPLKQGDLFFRMLIPLGIAGGFKTIRSIPLAGLFLTGGVAQVAKEETAGGAVETAKEGTTDGKVEPSKVERLTNPMKLPWNAFCILTTVAGTLLMTKAMPPQIPEGSAAFDPPFEAIKFIENNPPHGNLLNDPHFGAVMIWAMKHNPPVFIDPRYNLYGNNLLQDYWKMVDCKPGWQELMQHYDIGWVFLPPTLELSDRLASEPGWRLLYLDIAFPKNIGDAGGACVIYEKEKDNPAVSEIAPGRAPPSKAVEH